MTAQPAKIKKVFAWRTHFVFFVSIAVTVLLYTIPVEGNWAYPFMLLSTLAHELSHGVSALLVGAHFEQFVLGRDGSGWAQWSGNVSDLERAFIAAGGLVGPAILSTFCFVMGRDAKRARKCLLFLSCLLFVAEVLVVRERFGLAFVGGLALVLMIVALKFSENVAQMVLIFVAVQLGLSIFSRSDYLFTRYVPTHAGSTYSDVEYISLSLGLPYWFWGIICAGFSIMVLLIGMRLLLKHKTKKMA